MMMMMMIVGTPLFSFQSELRIESNIDQRELKDKLLRCAAFSSLAVFLISVQAF